MSKKTYPIPFTKNDMTGTWHMMEYTTAKPGEVGTRADGGTYMVPDEWRENLTFEALIRLEDQYKGRSAARVRVRNSLNGEVYSMGLQAFYEAVYHFGAAPNGYINGKWTFRKQGSNYTLFPVPPT